MRNLKCKGKTKTGKTCKNKALENAYCSIHNPVIKEKKGKEKLKEDKLDEILNIIYSVCKNRGWSCRLGNRDSQTFKFATIEVSKSFPKEYFDEKVTAVIDLDINVASETRIQIEPTSRYQYGIDSLYSSIIDALEGLSWLSEKEERNKTQESQNTAILIEGLLNRFDKAAQQLKRRYKNRPTIDINDEYDVQDVLHAILKCYFDDVRPEDYTPSYAGSCSRIDFLLKKEKVVVEVKCATDTLKDKKIGEQLIIDIKRYEAHPDCETLFFFIYDANKNIRNPTGLENDLTGVYGKNKLKVKVIISSK